MTKKSALPMSARHVQFYDEDLEFIDQMFGQRSAKQFGMAKAIREIVHKKVRDLRARVNEKLDAAGPRELASEQSDQE